MSAAEKLPVIAGVEITTDAQGRFNLNALHKASGLGGTKRPSVWLATKQSKELINELESQSQNSGSVLEVNNGGVSPGTFAHELLAVSYAGWISPAFQLKVNQVFIDWRTGKLNGVSHTPQSFADALRLAADLEDQKEKALEAKNKAIREKGQISSKREASVMGKLSVVSRKLSKVQDELGDSTNYKQVKAILWLLDVFKANRSMYQQVGKKLSAISAELNKPFKEIEDSQYGKVKAYPVEVIDEFRKRVTDDPLLLSKYR